MKILLSFAAFSAMLSVILGAFAAHGLKSKLSESLLNTFQTGVQYQMYHKPSHHPVSYFVSSSASVITYLQCRFYVRWNCVV